MILAYMKKQHIQLEVDSNDRTLFLVNEAMYYGFKMKKT